MPKDFLRAGEVSIEIQGVLKSIGFPPDVVRRASICAYEAEMNVVMHGGNGTFRITIDEGTIAMEVSDDGPGIEDIELALREGYSTAPPEYRQIGFGAGMGLPNIQKNADLFHIQSKRNEGTSLTISLRTNADGE